MHVYLHLLLSMMIGYWAFTLNIEASQQLIHFLLTFSENLTFSNAVMLFFFLFKCLKETMVGETSYNRVFLGWLFRILSFIVILLWNYSCSPILSLSNLQ